MDAFANQVALTLKGQTNVALFGPRDTGKTTFTNQLALELAKEHGLDAPPFDVVKINLQRVVSLAGFIGCVHDAMVSHPVKHLRRAAQRQVAALEKEIGFDIKVIKGTVRSERPPPRRAAETLHAQLVTLRTLSDHLVVIFDEFQRLRHCPGEPLAIIRSALMSSGANHVSLLFTGSIRNALQMMLESSDQPIFGEAAEMQLPAISRRSSSNTSTSNSRRPASRRTKTRSTTCSTPPRRTLGARSSSPGSAGPVPAPGRRVTLETVTGAHDRLVRTIERSEFSAVLERSDERRRGGGQRGARAPDARRSRGRERRPVARWSTRYGFSSASRVRPTLERLRRRG